ncbi:hypothetical protein EDB85DRAFT_1892402 [Lactarius pseudohatsudake]|nr:hypothetical protein EDB85DRAFT_1892402 [Lactarius pseudohatsudake]
MQPLKRKRDEFPTTPQKLMKIQLTVGEYTSAKMSPGRRLTCVVPGPLVIPATPSPPPPPPPPEDQVLNLFARASSVWNAYAVGSLRPFRLLVKWEDDCERANLCGAGQSVVFRICATSPSGKRRYVEHPSAILAEKATAHLGHQLTIGMYDSALYGKSNDLMIDYFAPNFIPTYFCQKLPKSSSADSVQENTS